MEWQWTREHNEALRQVQDAIPRAPVLQYFDKNKATVVQCDASSTGLGAVLIQEGKPIEFASRALTNTEMHYA